MHTKQTEKRKYDTVWKDPRYREKCHSLNLWKQQRDMFPDTFSSALDIGCGTGRLFKLLNDEGIDCDAFDISKNSLDKDTKLLYGDRFFLGTVWEMDLPKKNYDVGICTDVMEHFPPDKVSECIKRMHDHCETVVYKIGMFPSAFPNGVPFHLTIENKEYWEKELLKYGGSIKEHFNKLKTAHFNVVWSK